MVKNVETLLGRNLEGIYGNRILLNGELKRAFLRINGKTGKIFEIVTDKQALGKLEIEKKNSSTTTLIIDAGNLVVMPGIFDSHVHVNEPGRTEWEGFSTATKAALAGGVTTLIDMPLNSIPPTTTMENLQVKLDAARGKCFTDVGFWGGVVPNNADSLRPMVKKGVIGFKCFLIHSGVDEFPCVNEAEVDRALEELKGTDAVLAFHAEVDCGSCGNPRDDPNLYKSFLESRPDQMELEAIKMIDRQLRKHRNVRCHIVHLSTCRAMPIIIKLKEDGFPLTVETCPHYLTLNSGEISERQTQFKCCPPIRDKENQDELWNGLKSGVINMIVSDHSPCTPELKKPGEKNFAEAWGGISSVQFGMSIIWSQAKSRGFTVADLSSWMTRGPAELAGMSQRKGKFALDFDADFVIWDDQETFQVTTDGIYHKNKLTPYLGKTLTGTVKATVLRGHVAFANGRFAPAAGSLLVN